MRVIGDFSHNDLVNHRSINPQRSRLAGSVQRNAAGQQRTTEHSGTLEKSTPTNRGLAYNHPCIYFIIANR